MSAFYAPQIAEGQHEATQLRSVVEALTFNEEDPRLATLQGDVTKFEGNWNETKAALRQAQADLESYKEDVSINYMNVFRTRNPHIFEGDNGVANQERLLVFLDAGADMEIGADVMKRDAPFQEMFLELKNGGADDDAALKFAEQFFKGRVAEEAAVKKESKPPARAAAKMVSNKKVTQRVPPKAASPAARGMQGFKAAKDEALAKYFS